MSSILKALKKLEDEKAARKPDSLKIDAEILRDSTPHSSVSKVTFWGAIVFGCGVGATYMLMKGAEHPSAPSVSKSPAAMSTASPRPAPSPVPVVVPVERIAPEPAVVPASSPALPAKKPNGGAVTSAPKAAASLPERKIPATTPVAAPQREKTQPVSPQQESRRPAPAATLPPVLRVSGIAFQDGIDSVAMINGLPALKGTVIEGARVESIQRDRVQFTFGGEKFEVHLGKANR